MLSVTPSVVVKGRGRPPQMTTGRGPGRRLVQRMSGGNTDLVVGHVVQPPHGPVEAPFRVLTPTFTARPTHSSDTRFLSRGHSSRSLSQESRTSPGRYSRRLSCEFSPAYTPASTASRPPPRARFRTCLHPSAGSGDRRGAFSSGAPSSVCGTRPARLSQDGRSRRASIIVFLSRSAVRSGRFFTTSGGPWRRNTATSNSLVAGFQRLWDAGRVPSISSNGTNSLP